MDYIDKLKEQMWLFDIIVQRGPISFNAINEEWVKSEMSLKEPLAKRTFLRRRRELEEIFDIDVEVNADNEYYIANLNQRNKKNVRNVLLANIRESFFLRKFRGLDNKIQVPEVRMGREYLDIIGTALAQSMTLLMTYSKFTGADPYTVEIEPYCLKLYEQRWYIVARKLTEEQIKIFSLDRITALQPTDNYFIPNPNFNPATFFRNYYGIFVGTTNSPEKVVIKTTEIQAKYLRTLPLHQSQKEVSDCEFHYNIVITPDFVNELMRIGENIEILEPLSLKQQIRDRLLKMLERFK